MSIPVNQDMLTTMEGDAQWDSTTITYALGLGAAGANTQDAAQQDFGAAPAFQSISATDLAALEEIVKLWDELIAASLVEVNSNPDITVDQATNLLPYEGGVTFRTGHIDPNGD